MIAGRCVDERAFGDLSYDECHPILAVAESALADRTLAIAVRDTGSLAARALAPFTCDGNVRQR